MRLIVAVEAVFPADWSESDVRELLESVIDTHSLGTFRVETPTIDRDMIDRASRHLPGIPANWVYAALDAAVNGRTGADS